MRVLIGCEQFGHVRDAFRHRGHDAWSCDIEPDRTGSPFHLQADVLTVLDRGWDLAVFHPDCTWFANSAAWAFRDPDYDRWPGVGYHQRVRPETLTGADRRAARDRNAAFVVALVNCPIPRIAIENPHGYLSALLGPPTQVIQPHQFGGDASKATCLWLYDLPDLIPTGHVAPRMVGGRPRWANQTDSGQNRLSPSPDRAMARAATYPGIADAMAAQWGTMSCPPAPEQPTAPDFLVSHIKHT
jgi:hypothetical protein